MTIRRTRKALEQELRAAADGERATALSWFFRTEKGGYGAGDVFLGLTVPVGRKIALRYRDLSLADLARLLSSRFHEFRFAALEILVWRYEHGTDEEQEEIFAFYLDHTAGINNWDLVDTSAPYIVGMHLRSRRRDVLYRLAQSDNLWERRIAIVSTLGLVREGETSETFRVAEMLMGDTHDLIHKACGWALREAGKRSQEELKEFLRTHYGQLPRTTLRYAIERFKPEERKKWLLARTKG